MKINCGDYVVKTNNITKSPLWNRFDVENCREETFERFQCRECGWSVELQTKVVFLAIPEYTYSDGTIVEATPEHKERNEELLVEVLSILRDHVLICKGSKNE